MLKDAIFYAFVAISIFNTLHFGIYIAGANFYDIKKMIRNGRRQIRLVQPRPLVTIVVPAHNEEAGIIKTLESIRCSAYRKLQILVVDDASTDDTRKRVWRYIQDNPHLNLRLLRKQTNVGKGEAMNHAIRRYARGELLMTLDADSTLDRYAIGRAVKYFDNPLVAGLAANVQVLDDGSLLSLLQKFEHMIGYRSKKFYTMTNSEFIIGGVGSMYRMNVARAVKFYDTDTQTEDIGLSLKVVSSGNLHQKIIYAADVLAMTQGVNSYRALFKQRYRWKLGMLQNLLKYRRMIGSNSLLYSRMLTLYRLPLAIVGELILLIEPLLLIYVIYMSVLLMNPWTVVGAYLTICGYILWSLWPDEHLQTKNKWRLSAYVPIMYFSFYVMNAVQLVAILRCLKDYKKVLRRVDTGGAWVSPARSTSA